MDHVIHNLWLGGQRDADELVRHNPEKITAILNVRGSDAYQPPGRDQSAEHPDKAYKWIPAPDTGLISAGHVREAVRWLREQSERQHRILVHCMFGISRSPAFLAAFMVESGISSTLEEAKATISIHRNVQPAQQIAEPVRRVVLISALTGLPNRQAFEEAPSSPFLAVLDVDFIKIFNDVYGRIAGDMLLRRLAKILLSVGLDAYHSHEDEFLCRGQSAGELKTKLTEAKRMFREGFELYADGRIQIIEGTDFSFVIGTALVEQQAALRAAKNGRARGDAPEWLRQIVASTGHGQAW